MISLNSKRVAKNTLLLYLRMLFSLVVGLYTSRVVLQVLGVSDYGLYNVVGGVVVLFSFLTGALGGATSRFITFHLGKGDSSNLKLFFGNLLSLHIILSVIIFLLSETVGLWFLINQLNIPEGREIASMWVYQCSVISAIIGIVCLPYNSAIIAHESLNVFALLSVLETILKLVIVFLLPHINFDSLIVYSILFLLIISIIRFLYFLYSYFSFEEAKTSPKFNKSIIKEVSSFATWTLVGHFAVMGATQGINILLNLFFGTVVNAARAVAVQIQGVVMQFCVNFQMAINPQITKSYAENNFLAMHTLLSASSKFSFYLLYMIMMPVFLQTELILDFWLEEVPAHSVWFVRLILFQSLFLSVSNPLSISIQATGKIKKIKLMEGFSLILVFPLSFIALLFVKNLPEIVLIIACIVEFLTQILRIYLILPQINMPYGIYIMKVVLPILRVSILSVVMPLLLTINSDVGISSFVAITLVSFLSVIICIFCFGCTSEEKKFLYNFISKKKLKYIKII